MPSHELMNPIREHAAECSAALTRARTTLANLQATRAILFSVDLFQIPAVRDYLHSFDMHGPFIEGLESCVIHAVDDLLRDATVEVSQLNVQRERANDLGREVADLLRSRSAEKKA